jgi:hypothetical protein
MSKEKQIEEMAKVLIDYTKKNHIMASHVILEDYAEQLYNAGYRKQSEGKWIWINQAKGYLEPPYGDTCKCSLCEFEIDVSESNYNFCPNCGAKMKGGAE